MAWVLLLHSGAARRRHRCLRTRRDVPLSGSRARMRWPRWAARASQASRTGSKPCSRQTSYHPPKVVASEASASSGGRLCAQRGQRNGGELGAFGMAARLTPMPMASAVARRSPQDAGEFSAFGQDVIGPFHRVTALGAKCAAMSAVAMAATKQSCAHSAAGVPARSASVAKRLPRRSPRRGRGGRGPRSGGRRRIQSGPVSPAAARRSASALVESSSGNSARPIAGRNSRQQRFRGGVGDGDQGRSRENEQQRKGSGQGHDQIASRRRYRCRRPAPVPRNT